MDGRRFDELARALAGSTSRRRFLGGVGALATGLLVGGTAGAACGPGQVNRRGGCVCTATGRPPVGGICPCPKGQTDSGDGLGCLACRADADCKDDNPCTLTACTSGRCTKERIACPPTVTPCHQSVCDPSIRGCREVPVADGTPCETGNLCTADTCQGGACVGGPVNVVCAPLDPCRVAGTCDPATGRCSNPLAPDGAACDDGNRCTTNDVCTAGVCAGTPVVCTASDQCHDPGVCDTDTGTCTNPPKPDGVSCNDGNACSQTDTCQAGICSGANPVVCAPPDQCHQVGVCNAATGLCEYLPKADGAPCDDGDACTRTDTCQAGVCVGGNPVTCTALDQCHEVGVCNPATGLCSNPARANGVACESGNLCTVDSCQDGLCVVGPVNVFCPPITDAQCQEPVACDPATGRCPSNHKPDSTPCETGNLCTFDFCQNGVCSQGPLAVFCEEPGNVECQRNDCNPETGQCVISGIREGLVCEDNDSCNRNAVCTDGACVGERIVCEPRECDERVMCNNNGCLRTPKPNGTQCSTGICCNGICCPSGNTCCSGGSEFGCCAGDCCGGSTCCAFSNGVCCGDGTCRIGVGC